MGFVKSLPHPLYPPLLKFSETGLLPFVKGDREGFPEDETFGKRSASPSYTPCWMAKKKGKRF